MATPSPARIALLPAAHPEVKAAVSVAAKLPVTHPLVTAVAKQVAQLPPQHETAKAAAALKLPQAHPIAAAVGHGARMMAPVAKAMPKPSMVAASPKQSQAAAAIVPHVQKLPASHPDVRHSLNVAAQLSPTHPLSVELAKKVAALPPDHPTVQHALAISPKQHPAHPVSRAVAAKVAQLHPSHPLVQQAKEIAKQPPLTVVGQTLQMMPEEPEGLGADADWFDDDCPPEPPPAAGEPSHYGTRLEQNRKRKWSEPTFIETNVAPRGTAGTVFPAGELRGYWSCCNIWVRAPAGWFTGATKGTIYLYAREGASEQLVSQVRLDQFTVQSDGTYASCLAAWVCGLPCEGFRCEFVFAGDVSGLAEGTIRIEVFGEDMPFDLGVGGFNVSGLGTSALPIGGILNPPMAPMPVTALSLGKVSGGGWAPLHVDTAGDLQVDATAVDPTVTLYDSGGFADSGVITNAAGKLLSLRWLNTSAATIYLQVFNAAAVPADGTTPSMAPIAIPPKGAIEVNGILDSDAWVPFATGICWAASSTVATKTVTATAPLWVTATYRT